MFTLSHAIEAYRTVANADGKSARTVEWVTTVSARFGRFLREDPAKGRRGNQGADHALVGCSLGYFGEGDGAG